MKGKSGVKGQISEIKIFTNLETAPCIWLNICKKNSKTEIFALILKITR